MELSKTQKYAFEKFKHPNKRLHIAGSTSGADYKFYLDKIIVNEKNTEENKLAQLKNYLDKNTINYLNSDFNIKKIYLFLKDLIEFI